MNEFRTELRRWLDIELSNRQVQLLESHYNLLVKWNKILNLTTVVRLEDAVQRHYAESLLLSRQLSSVGLGDRCVIVDAGSGAGFPGVPVAVDRPGCRVILVESHHRKAAFLAEATRGWANVRVIPKRLDDIHTPCDMLITRAVAWEQIASVAGRIAGAVGLLVGAVDAEAIAQTPGFAWSLPAPLPWNAERVVLLGVRH